MHFMASFKTCNTEGEKSRKPRCPPFVISLGSKQISSKPQVRSQKSQATSQNKFQSAGRLSRQSDFSAVGMHLYKGSQTVLLKDCP